MIYRVLFRDGGDLSLDAADEFAAVDEARFRCARRQIWRIEDDTGRVVLGEGYENPPEEETL